MSSDTALSRQPILTLSACGRQWFMERTPDIDTLWDAMEISNEDERIPYWTEVWPSSLVLAEWLSRQRQRIADQMALDLGCGVGLTALAGSWLGAKVIGADYEPEALHYARLNALRNKVPMPVWIAMDWRHPAIVPHSLPFIWAGDIMYERRFVQPIADFLDYALSPTGTVWIAEPCRTIYELFRATLIGRRWRCFRVFETQTESLYPQKRPVPVRVWEIRRLTRVMLFNAAR